MEAPKRHRSSAAEMADEQRRVEKLLLADLRRRDATVGMKLSGERALAEKYGASLRVVRGVLTKLRNNAVLQTAPRTGTRLNAPLHPLAGKRIAYVTFIELSHPQHIGNDNVHICALLESQLSAEGATLELINFWRPGWYRGADTGYVQKQLETQKFDAVIVLPDEKITVPRIAPGVPVIYIGDRVSSGNRVNFNNKQNGRIAARHLLELGHRDIAVLRLAMFAWSCERAAAVCGEIATVPGTTVREIPLLKYENPFCDSSELEHVAAQIVEAPVTAVIAPNDAYAAQLLGIFQKLGKPVPEALSLVGFDDLGSLRPCNLTTVQRLDIELGRAAHELLKELFIHPESRNEPRDIRLDCPLLIRSTTRTINFKEDEK